MPTLPFKLNQDRCHHIPRQRRKVTNWRDYDTSLRQRNSLTSDSPQRPSGGWVNDGSAIKRSAPAGGRARRRWPSWRRGRTRPKGSSRGCARARSANTTSQARISPATPRRARDGVSSGWASWPRRLVQQPIRALGVEPQHPVAHDLEPHTAEPGRLRAPAPAADAPARHPSRQRAPLPHPEISPLEPALDDQPQWAALAGAFGPVTLRMNSTSSVAATNASMIARKASA